MRRLVIWKIFGYVLIFWERRTLKKRSNFGLKIEFFISFLKFDLACRKVEASQGFWYQGVDTDILFRNWSPPICITIDVPAIAHFP